MWCVEQVLSPSMQCSVPGGQVTSCSVGFMSKSCLTSIYDGNSCIGECGTCSFTASTVHLRNWNAKMRNKIASGKCCSCPLPGQMDLYQRENAEHSHKFSQFHLCFSSLGLTQSNEISFVLMTSNNFLKCVVIQSLIDVVINCTSRFIFHGMACFSKHYPQH